MQHAALKRENIWINLFFLYLAITTLVGGLVVTRQSRDWLVADWLINYQGGFVRRGLTGQAALIVSKLLHLSPVIVAATLYLTLFGLLFALARSLVLASSRNLWVIALMLSPATLSVQVLHPMSGFRKELILFVALAGLLILLRKFELSSTFVICYMTLALSAGILSHEGLAFYTPYYFAALVVGGRSVRRAAIECILPFVSALVVAYICAKHPGNLSTVNQICQSLGFHYSDVPGSEICSGGAIVYLRTTSVAARSQIAGIVTQYHYLDKFPLFAVLALMPVFPESSVLLRARRKIEIFSIWASGLLSFVFSLVLFIYGSDWGRWIYIHAMCLMLLLLALDGKAFAESESSFPRLGSFSQRGRIARISLVVAYSALWMLPNGIEPLRLGYIGRALYLRHYEARKAPQSRQGEIEP